MTDRFDVEWRTLDGTGEANGRPVRDLKPGYIEEKAMKRTERLILGVVVFILSLAFTGAATAHDLEPPAWRDLTHPYYTLSEWQFSTPLNPAPAENTPCLGNGVPPSGFTSPVAIMGPGMQYNPLIGGWYPIDPSGGNITLEVNNWIDYEPYKIIRVQMTYFGDPSAQPDIINVFGDDHATGPATAVPVGPAQWYSIDQWDTEWHWWQDWEMIPNPDWEVIQIFVPRDTLVHQIVVDTISAPEPATAGLLLCGGLAALRRRNPHK